MKPKRTQTATNNNKKTVQQPTNGKLKSEGNTIDCKEVKEEDKRKQYYSYCNCCYFCFSFHIRNIIVVIITGMQKNEHHIDMYVTKSGSSSCSFGGFFFSLYIATSLASLLHFISLFSFPSNPFVLILSFRLFNIEKRGVFIFRYAE